MNPILMKKRNGEAPEKPAKSGQPGGRSSRGGRVIPGKTGAGPADAEKGSSARQKRLKI